MVYNCSCSAFPVWYYIVQQECIPQAVLGTDIICQAKSGMGKTAVFVLAVLHQLTPVPGQVCIPIISIIIIYHHYINGVIVFE